MLVDLRSYSATLRWPEHPEARVDLAPHGVAECTVTLRDGGRWHDLMDSDDTEPRWTTVANITAIVPRGAFLPRERGLEIVRAAAAGGPDVLRATHRWRPVPAWVADRGEHLLRDPVDALFEVAFDEGMRIVTNAPQTVPLPPRVRTLACLLAVHNEAMANGLGQALELWARQWGEAVTACDELGLTDVAAMLRRLGRESADVELTDEVYFEYIRLTTPGEWHGEDAIRTALRHQVARAPREYGVDEVPPPLPATYEELLPTDAGAFLRLIAAVAGAP